VLLRSPDISTYLMKCKVRGTFEVLMAVHYGSFYYISEVS
jgi:hypothetical protein